MATRILNVILDETKCLDHECCQVAPDVFVMRAYHSLTVAADATRYFDTQRDLIIEAALSCPMSAITLEFADGRVITSEDYERIGGFRSWQDY